VQTQPRCTAELVDTPWNPWPADLCRGLLDGSNRTTSLARWVAAPNNPAHNRQASFRAADNPGNPTVTPTLGPNPDPDPDPNPNAG